MPGKGYKRKGGSVKGKGRKKKTNTKKKKY